MGKLELELAQLSAAELDDQALEEITALLATSGGGPLPAARLIDLAGTGDLVVGRRPCGSLPEIVAVAARLSGSAGEVVVAVDPANGPKRTSLLLRAQLGPARSSASLFRRADRAPLGFTHAS